MATVALDVLRGLEYMHAHSMLHRDVKVRAATPPLSLQHSGVAWLTSPWARRCSWCTTVCAQ